ncbi:MAG: YaaL family protein [Clostridiales bacterium]|nr:YaaL family protein [Clostridiales bacterium]
MGKYIHKEPEDEQGILIGQIRQTESQLKAAGNFFNEAKEISEVDQAIYQIKALEAQYSRLLKTAKKQNINGQVQLLSARRI